MQLGKGFGRAWTWQAEDICGGIWWAPSPLLQLLKRLTDDPGGRGWSLGGIRFCDLLLHLLYCMVWTELKLCSLSFCNFAFQLGLRVLVSVIILIVKLYCYENATRIPTWNVVFFFVIIYILFLLRCVGNFFLGRLFMNILNLLFSWTWVMLSFFLISKLVDFGRNMFGWRLQFS